MIASSACAAFAAGLATSFGPCVAPRFLAVTALAKGVVGWRRFASISIFIAGLCACYVALGMTGGLLAVLAGHTRALYLALSAVAVAFGLRTLLREPQSACRAHGKRESGAAGALFLSGGSFAAISSPCCGPLAAGLAGAGVAAGSWQVAGVLLAAFALGHAVPLLALGQVWERVRTTIVRRVPPGSSEVVTGSLMLALGAYYGIVA